MQSKRLRQAAFSGTEFINIFYGDGFWGVGGKAYTDEVVCLTYHRQAVTLERNTKIGLADAWLFLNEGAAMLKLGWPSDARCLSIVDAQALFAKLWKIYGVGVRQSRVLTDERG